MVKIFELQSNDRTIWTIAYHPRIPSLLATGSVGGIVTVYENYVRTINQTISIHLIDWNNFLRRFKKLLSKNFMEIKPSSETSYHRYASIHCMISWRILVDVMLKYGTGGTIDYCTIWRGTQRRGKNNSWLQSKTRADQNLHDCNSQWQLISLFFRFMKFNPVNNMLITIQTYQQYNDSNCVSNFFNMIAAVSLLLNCAYEPCYVKDAINNVINKLVKISLKCQLDCDSQNFLNSVSFHACPKHCNGFNFKHFS